MELNSIDITEYRLLSENEALLYTVSPGVNSTTVRVQFRMTDDGRRERAGKRLSSRVMTPLHSMAGVEWAFPNWLIPEDFASTKCRLVPKNLANLLWSQPNTVLARLRVSLQFQNVGSRAFR